MKIIKKNPTDCDAIILMEELSKTLESITGDSGKNSFDPSDVCIPRSLFVIAYDEAYEPLGCGAIRPIDEDIAEVKRMFAKAKTKGVGTKILLHLESEALKLGYSTIWLETRVINRAAVSFYKKRGYIQIPNYGKYINNPKAICFEKKLL
ncbi:GNAT family N-acetyltransferase [Clostridium folliculivorans]|uniref:N-acetyltransferase n=1 Tax=Clostridium folliculivorans TaxID=2886038 RepID=A0A9W6DAI2_9CLOT|nr:GNAT family N-acetyltransferase [Clostridium folliculivorans]GKU25244.1 N-acetyltransferase [Clostridium folliculivorans]GKU28265.1 N-acetyltransferase [Clostridium folliculivorans]